MSRELTEKKMRWIWVEDVRTSRKCCLTFSSLIGAGLTNRDIKESAEGYIGSGKRPSADVVSIALIGLVGTVPEARRLIREQKSLEAAQERKEGRTKKEDKKKRPTITSHVALAITVHVHGRKGYKTVRRHHEDLAKRVVRWQIIEGLSAREIAMRLHHTATSIK